MYEYLTIVNSLLSLATTVTLICILMFLRGAVYEDEVADERVAELSPPTTYDEYLSVKEHVALRELNFDERIRKMKEDLANSTYTGKKPVTAEAEELHPDVRNLPHNILPTGTSPNTIEIAD